MARRSKEANIRIIKKSLERHGNYYDCWATPTNSWRAHLGGGDMITAARSFEAVGYEVIIEHESRHDLPVYRGGKHVAWGGTNRSRHVTVRKVA